MTNLPDGFIYSGNPHESVPRALFLDRRITPIERNAWQVIRMLLQADQITAFPSYEELKPYLTSLPYADKASSETVARAMTILRLTRWLSLYKKRRSSSGHIQSNLYILHDAPVSLLEALELDPEYLYLVCQSVNHASKSIQIVASKILEEINQDPTLSKAKLPTRLEILIEQVNRQRYPQRYASSESEVTQNNLIRNQKKQHSESESGQKVNNINSVRNPKSDVRSSKSNNINILLQQGMVIPERFKQLPQQQQQAVLTSMQHLSLPLQQQVFIEWDKRCATHQVRNPPSYLFGIIQKAYKGELNALVETPTMPQQSTPPPMAQPKTEPKIESKRTDRDTARQKLAEIKQMIKTHGR
ncbi:STY4528 family pathogenicity island replication protein [Zophobihabitans entericus]|uniref:Uncharacterized protein n=1 Tax=Zophobihabitans entericus TaxID=1635327 RepID=A0A6G9ID18_9GAMM|nr:STY4528 family pathogenicity island replication protein [Zophobihabitans entericus]QIQ22125.1 hypothetical protein IPMB12_10790 [Zophobihabitans entericus]